MARPISSAPAQRVAVWYWKGGVGKSTTTMMLSILAASKRQPVLTIDLDPECGTSRDFIGRAVREASVNLKTYLESPSIGPPPTIPTGIDHLHLLPGSPDSGRFFRHFPESSLKLREGLDLLSSDYRWIFLDVPHQLDNIAQLGLIAADYVILPLELTEDCLERLETVLAIYEESKIYNPRLQIIGGLPLGLAPRRDRNLSISAKEEEIYIAYRDALSGNGIPLFETIMYLSAKHSVEDARINANFRSMHWTAQRRYRGFYAEVVAAINAISIATTPSHARSNRKTARPAASKAA